MIDTKPTTDRERIRELEATVRSLAARVGVLEGTVNILIKMMRMDEVSDAINNPRIFR